MATDPAPMNTSANSAQTATGPTPMASSTTAAQPAADYDAPPPPPPQPNRRSTETGDDSSSPVHYTRDPHKLIAYLLPFPKPNIRTSGATIPDRFLIYTPPPPPLAPPKEGEKEGRAHKVQRKWQEEVRDAKTSDAKVTSWKGVKGRATKGINWAVGKTTSSSIDFLNRVPGKSSPSDDNTTQDADPHSADNPNEEAQTKRTVGLEEMILVYPASVPGSEAEIREEFINSMLRSKSKAQKDAIIATGLMPVSLAIDILAMVVWPFGGLAEIDGVWAMSSIRGAKTARSVTKRLHSTSASDDKHDEQQLRLSFTSSPRIDVLAAYLAAECHRRDARRFPSAGPAPTETEVLEAIGWSPSQSGGETRNWEDEQWETTEVKEDLRQVTGKGAREWDKWCKEFEKDPDKALGVKK